MDLRYGFPHFDTYQYSASVGPQAQGMRPKLLWVEAIPEFENGAELTLPGLYWVKLAVFSLIPYGLLADQALSFTFLVLASALGLISLRQAGWGNLVSFLMFSLMLTAPTFLVNVTGTRPEPLAVLLCMTGIMLIRNLGSNYWGAAGGLVLGFAGSVHVYAALLGPIMAFAAWLSVRKIEERVDWRKLASITLGLAIGWSMVAIFWWSHLDAWHLFRINLAVQRGFHHNPGRFIAYLESFRLASGWWVAGLLTILPLGSWIHWFRSGCLYKTSVFPLAVSCCCFVIPSTFWILKTEQYFYGDLIWPALIAALLLVGREGVRIRKLVVLLLLLSVSGGLVRLVARARLGVHLFASKPVREQRLDWLKERVSNAPRLYIFTTEWDIASEIGVSDVRFYAFPLPMTTDVVRQFGMRTMSNTPDGTMMLFERDYAANCPYANPGAFDPSGSSEWEMLETRTWHYDLSASKPPARIWELWRKRARS